ncbi:MAG: tyrosine-protein phosphatase, partial [Candidatus Eremiobacterota bacterium]
MRRLVLLFALLLLAPLAAQPGRGIALQATRNTRDLGGLPVRGGNVKKHMVYRSGALCFLTVKDV